ncbi:hypothetical protein Tco_0968915 [Tanacetum coccineum]
MISSRISISLAMRNPARGASYSASLLVVSNANLNVYVYYFPSGMTTISPAPEPLELEAQSVNSFHAFLGSSSFLLTYSFFASLLSGSGVSARKSANICPLIEFLPLNSISCSPNSMAHLAMLPNFLAYMRANISFSNSGYFNSALCNVRLTKYTGICFFPLSAISTAPTISYEVARLRLLLLSMNPSYRSTTSQSFHERECSFCAL